MLALAIAVIALILTAGIWCWTLAFLRLARGLPLVAWSERRDVPWAFFDLVAMVAIYVALSITVSFALDELQWLPDPIDIERLTLSQRQVLTLVSALVSFLVLLAGLPVIALRSRADAADLGWSAAHFLHDVWLGAVAFVMLAPPVYALQGVLVYFWKPSKHPLMEMFRGTPDPWFFAVLFVSAAIVAPLFEELIFRVLLQGYLEKYFTFRYSPQELLFGGPRREPGVQPVEAIAPVPAGNSLPIDDNPFAQRAAPALTMGAETTSAPTGSHIQSKLHCAVAWLPISISSLVFALLHWEHGPDWIPLTFLAIGMGYLYQRTQRLVPSLIVHMGINGLSLAGLWIQVQEGVKLPGN